MDPRTAALTEIARLPAEANQVAMTVGTPRALPTVLSSKRPTDMLLEEMRAVPGLRCNCVCRYETTINRAFWSTAPQRGDGQSDRESVGAGRRLVFDQENRPGKRKRAASDASVSSLSGSDTPRGRRGNHSTAAATEHTMPPPSPPTPRKTVTQRVQPGCPVSTYLMPHPLELHPSTTEWTGFTPIPIRVMGRTYPNKKQLMGFFDPWPKTEKSTNAETPVASGSGSQKGVTKEEVERQRQKVKQRDKRRRAKQRDRQNRQRAEASGSGG